jgi:hypothetical protein
VLAYPGAYVAHRLVVVGRGLGWTGAKPGFLTPVDQYPEVLAQVGQTLSLDPFQRAVSRVLRRIHRWPIFSPILYILLAAGLLWLHRRDPLLRGLLSGALASTLALVVVLPGGNDYRYVHWLAVVAILASVVRVVSVYDARPARPSPG